MTLSKFHNLLGKLLVENQAGRLSVCIDKSTFHHNCEADGIVILEVEGAEIRSHTIDDGDGGALINKDGTERLKTSIVLYGNAHETRSA